MQPLDLGIIQNFKVHYRKLLLRHVIAMATGEHTSASEISNTLNVLQAMNWMGSAWCKVEVATISKCFAAAGFSNNSETPGDENEDPFDLDDDFQRLIDVVASGSSVTPQIYLELDKELPVCFNADVNEQQLLESLNTSDQDTIILESADESDIGEDENESPPTSRLKSCREVLESVRDIELFFLQRGKFTLANEFSLLADKVSENAVNERSHQSTLERYFITK